MCVYIYILLYNNKIYKYILLFIFIYIFSIVPTIAYLANKNYE